MRKGQRRSYVLAPRKIKVGDGLRVLVELTAFFFAEKCNMPMSRKFLIV